MDYGSQIALSPASECSWGRLPIRKHDCQSWLRARSASWLSGSSWICNVCAWRVEDLPPNAPTHVAYGRWRGNFGFSKEICKSTVLSHSRWSSNTNNVGLKMSEPSVWAWAVLTQGCSRRPVLPRTPSCSIPYCVFHVRLARGGSPAKCAYACILRSSPAPASLTLTCSTR